MMKGTTARNGSPIDFDDRDGAPDDGIIVDSDRGESYTPSMLFQRN